MCAAIGLEVGFLGFRHRRSAICMIAQVELATQSRHPFAVGGRIMDLMIAIGLGVLVHNKMRHVLPL